MQQAKTGARKEYEVRETRKQLFSKSLAFEDCNIQITSLPAHPAHGYWCGLRPVAVLHVVVRIVLYKCRKPRKFRF